MSKKHDSALKHLQELASDLENESRAWKGIVDRVSSNDSSLTAVELHYAALGSRGSRHLAKGLRKNTNVKELKVRRRASRSSRSSRDDRLLAPTISRLLHPLPFCPSLPAVVGCIPLDTPPILPFSCLPPSLLSGV